MNNFILSFDLVRTEYELGQLNELLGGENLYAVAGNSHAYVVRFDGTAAELREYLRRTEITDPHEDLFIGHVQRWSVASKAFHRGDEQNIISCNQKGSTSQRHRDITSLHKV